MAIAIVKGRKTRPDIKLGICGEHGGDPDSVKFCHKLGLSYVSWVALRRTSASSTCWADTRPSFCSLAMRSYWRCAWS